jgi:predicted nuclease of predicted toxin-antitoxin system
MTFFSDHDVYGQTIKFVRTLGHIVIRAQDVGLAKAEDSAILQYAASNNLILITRDKGFGALVFQKQATSGGVILLRIHPSTMSSVHHQLNRALDELNEAEIRRSFIAVETKQYRVRLIP